MIKNIYVLSKFPLSFTISLSAIFGYVLANGSIDMGLLYPYLAVLFLAMGVSCFNQVQECKKDALMPRTKNRPIPSGDLSFNAALSIGIILTLLSCFLIYLPHGFMGIIVFIIVAIIYNLLYTPAKRYSIYAGVYGAVLGVIPPYIGWVSAAEFTFDLKFFALGLFYFTWQIPHFWLLNLKYYKQYEDAGFPTITKAFGIDSLVRMTFIWLLLTVICGVFLVAVFEVQSVSILVSLAILKIYTLYTIFRLIKNRNYIYNFININIYMLFLMIILNINALFM